MCYCLFFCLFFLFVYCCVFFVTFYIGPVRSILFTFERGKASCVPHLLQHARSQSAHVECLSPGSSREHTQHCFTAPEGFCCAGGVSRNFRPSSKWLAFCCFCCFCFCSSWCCCSCCCNSSRSCFSRAKVAAWPMYSTSLALKIKAGIVTRPELVVEWVEIEGCSGVFMGWKLVTSCNAASEINEIYETYHISHPPLFTGWRQMMQETWCACIRCRQQYTTLCAATPPLTSVLGVQFMLSYYYWELYLYKEFGFK